MTTLLRILTVTAALVVGTAFSAASGDDTLRTAGRWTQEFRDRLPLYQAHVANAIRGGRTTDKAVMDSLRGEVRALGVLLMNRDSLLLSVPGNGWPLVAGLEDDLALVDAAPPEPGVLVQLAYQHRRYQLRFVSLRGSDSSAIEPQARKRIETSILHWGERVDEKLWPSLQLALLENGVPLGPFSTGEAFTAAMIGYLETRRTGGDDHSALEPYRRFKLFWGGDVRSVWLPVLVWSGRLKVDDVNTIDRLVDRWDRSTMPGAWWDDVYAAVGILGLLAAIVAVFSFWRRRRKS